MCSIVKVIICPMIAVESRTRLQNARNMFGNPIPTVKPSKINITHYT